MALGDLVPLTTSRPSAAPLPPSSAAPLTAPTAAQPAALTTVSSLAQLEQAAHYARAQGRVKCQRHASGPEMALLLVYLMVLTGIALYSLYCLWPRPTPSEQAPSAAAAPPKVNAAQPQGLDTSPRATTAPQQTDTSKPTAPDSIASVINPCDATGTAVVRTRVVPDSVRAQMVGVCYLGQPYFIWKERQLLLLVLLAGAVGGLLSGMRKSTQSYYKGDLCAEGLPGLYTWPLSASLVGLVFYVFIRGGFFSGQSTVGQTSTYSFVATALLAGMFTHEAYGKLKQIAETVLTRVDSKPIELPSTTPSTTTSRAPVNPATPTGSTTPANGGGERGVIPSAPPPSPAVASPPGTVG
jgi:hypothetical protein